MTEVISGEQTLSAVKIECGWPLLYLFFQGRTTHIEQYVNSNIYRRAIDQNADSIERIMLALEQLQDMSEDRFDQLLAGQQELLDVSRMSVATLRNIASEIRDIVRWARSVQKHGLPLE